MYTRSARRFRYGTTWLTDGSSQPAVVAATASRSARRTTVRATSSAAATRVSPGKHELLRRLEAVGDVVDDRLQRRHHLGGHPRDAVVELVPVRGLGRQLGAHHEQLALEADQQGVELAAPLGLGPGQCPSAETTSSVAP